MDNRFLPSLETIRVPAIYQRSHDPNDRLRMGHITIPPYHFHKEGLIEKVRQVHSASGDQKKMLLFIAPNDENHQDVMFDESDHSPFEMLGFGQLLDSFRENRST